MIRRHTVIACLWALVALPCLAQEGGEPAPAHPASKMVPVEAPSTNHHEFNTAVPTSFTGSMMQVAGEGDARVDLYASGDPACARQILLIHEWWGLNEHIKGLADQFAAMGLRAYAIDLYGQTAGGDAEVARKLMQEANAHPEIAKEKLRLAIGHAAKENPAAKIATIGWCFGGGWSLQTAIDNPADIDACIVYYGQLEVNPERLAMIQAPMLGIFAEKDTWITPALVGQFDDAMKRAGKKAEIHIYPADHGFANPSGQRFVEEHGRAAWRRTLEFIDKNL